MQSAKWMAVAVAFAAVACGGTPEAGDEFGEQASELSRRYDTGRLIVKFKGGTSASTKSSVHRANGGAKKKGLANGAEVVSVARASTRSILAKYKASRHVQYAEIDALVPHDDLTVRRPNDPYLSYQWQHDAIEAPGAWAAGTGASSVLVAVCDTGVSQTHPDLRPALRLDLCWNTVYGRAGDCDPVDWHGTGVAGSAAGLGNNGVGIAGSAWSASIIPVRVSNEFDGTAYISDMADCIHYGADKGASVINLSYQTYDNGTIYQTILDAAAYAEGKGAITFVASGNEGVNAVTSQDPTNLVYVGATAQGGAIASFSNYGAFVDLAAPGEDVVTTGVNVSCADANGNGTVDRGECSSSGDTYYYASGTSFASPIAAGAAIVLKALKPTATPAELRSALYTTAKDLGVAGSDAYYGFGLLNLHAAAHKLAGTATQPVNGAPTIRITSPGSGAVGTTGMPHIVEAYATDAEDGDLSSLVQWTFGDGQSATGQVWGNHVYTRAGTYTITAKVTDRGGLGASASISFVVQDPVVNTAPTLTISEPSSASITVVQGTSVRFTATARDGEEGDLTSQIAWTVPGGTVYGGSFSQPFGTLGTFTIRGTVSDAAGLSDSRAITVTVTSAGTLPAPTGLTATLPARRSVRLNWVDTSSNETGFYVERAAVWSTGVGTWYRRATLGANATTYGESVSKGTWAYRIRAYNASTNAVSGTVQITAR